MLECPPGLEPAEVARKNVLRAVPRAAGYYITNATIGSLLTAATLATAAQLAWRLVR